MEVPKFGSFKPKKKIIPGEEEEKSLAKENVNSSRRSPFHRVEKVQQSGERRRDHHSGERRRDHHSGECRRDHHSEERNGNHHSAERRRDHRRRREQDHHHQERRGRGSPDEQSHPRKDRHKTSKDVDLDHKEARNAAEDKRIVVPHVESDLFIIDRRGDSKNIEYGSLHRYSVPAYRRTGYGNLIGGPSSSKIDRETSNEKEIYLIDAGPGNRGSQKVSRLLSSKYGRNSETRLKFVSAVDAGVEDGEGDDFIEFSSSRKRKRDAASPEVDGGVDYRSIEGKAKASDKPADDDVRCASDSDDAGHDNVDLRARQESAVLSKKAKARPSILDNWLALAEHQSQLIRPGTDPARFTTSERGTLAELRLSILNEAGKHISPGRPDRERLLIVMIEEGAPLWDKQKLATKWREVLKECPSSILLWTRYMDFIQYDHSSFQYETCREAYLTWLQVLKTAYQTPSGENKTQVSQTQIYALLRFTNFIRDCGYDELAISIWQILLELHFFAPKELEGSSLEARLESLEDYWDIEAPRIGEEGTLTWAGFHDLGPSTATSRPPTNIPKPNIDLRTPFTSFAREEAALSQIFILPASTEDEDALTDPFRCIMFDDLRPAVERLSMELPKEDLIDAFLHYLDLPLLSRDSQNLWSKDAYLATTPDSVKMHAQRQSTLTLFESAFQPFHARHGSSSEIVDLKAGGFASFIDNTLHYLLQTLPDEDDSLREYYLAFKAKLFPNEASKTAKKLLKSRPTSLRLYNAFALLEAQAGRLEKAFGVWEAALGMLSKLDVGAQEDAVILWHSRFLTQIQQADGGTAALRKLLAISNPEELSGGKEPAQGSHISQQLRLRRDLESGFDRNSLCGRLSHAVLYADLLAWLTYLTTQQDITNTLFIYNSHITTLPRSAGGTPTSTVAAVEELQQWKARFLTYHIDRKRGWKPKELGGEIERALMEFPGNSPLLQLHSRIVSHDRLRSLVNEEKNSFKTEEMEVVEWVFKIEAEMKRVVAGDGFLTAGGGTINTVRATFAKALSTTGGKGGVAHSIVLWNMWLEFELERRKGSDVNDKTRQDGGKARNVFLDGLRAIPGMKSWAIRGMAEDGLLEEMEMRRVWEGVVGRGLRVRGGVEGVL